MNTTTEVTLRNWTKDDFKSVRHILLTTWKVTYSFIPEKDIITHLENYYSETKLLELFNNIFTKGILAEIDTNPVAWMKLFEDKVAGRFYISSLYVLPENQGLGIGKKFLLKAEEAALQINYTEIWLGVMKDNIKALDWYKKIGFNFVEEEPFKMGETEVLHLIGYKALNQIN